MNAVIILPIEDIKAEPWFDYTLYKDFPGSNVFKWITNQLDTIPNVSA